MQCIIKSPTPVLARKGRENMEELTQAIQNILRQKTNDTVYILWLSSIEYKLEDNVLEVISTSEFKKNVVESQFSSLIEQAAKETLSDKVELHFSFKGENETQES